MIEMTEDQKQQVERARAEAIRLLSDPENAFIVLCGKRGKAPGIIMGMAVADFIAMASIKLHAMAMRYFP